MNLGDIEQLAILGNLPRGETLAHMSTAPLSVGMSHHITIPPEVL